MNVRLCFSFCSYNSRCLHCSAIGYNSNSWASCSYLRCRPIWFRVGLCSYRTTLELHSTSDNVHDERIACCAVRTNCVAIYMRQTFGRYLLQFRHCFYKNIFKTQNNTNDAGWAEKPDCFWELITLLSYSYTTVYCGLHERNTRVYPTVDSGITNLTHYRLLIVCVHWSVNKRGRRTEWLEVTPSEHC